MIAVVLFHGMGDSCCSSGMTWIRKEIEQEYPGIYIHSIIIGNNEGTDRLSSIYDNLSRQIAEVCDQLADIPELASGFDGVGFSQGGLFLRAFVERCNHPKMRNLITIGSPHQGIKDLPTCQSVLASANTMIPRAAPTFMQALSQVEEGFFPSPLHHSTVTTLRKCSWWETIMKQQVYSDFAQSHIVQAQYFKDPNRMDDYRMKSGFLADINNESSYSKPKTSYADNMATLDNFVMFMFEDDTQIVPRQSSWFGWYDGQRLVPLEEQEIFLKDWIGLRSLLESGRLHRLTLPGEHMRLEGDFVKRHLSPWIGRCQKETKVLPVKNQ